MVAPIAAAAPMNPRRDIDGIETSLVKAISHHRSSNVVFATSKRLAHFGQKFAERRFRHGGNLRTDRFDREFGGAGNVENLLQAQSVIARTVHTHQGRELE
jgi:hypothetical protein